MSVVPLPNTWRPDPARAASPDPSPRDVALEVPAAAALTGAAGAVRGGMTGGVDDVVLASGTDADTGTGARIGAGAFRTTFCGAGRGAVWVGVAVGAPAFATSRRAGTTEASDTAVSESPGV